MAQIWRKQKRNGSVLIHERACSIGNIIGINAYRIKMNLLKLRLADGGYEINETAHFLLCRRTEMPTLIIVHWFAPEKIDADLGYYMMQELKPLDILNDPEEFGKVFGAVVCSLFPQEAHTALCLYGQNTLQQYQQLLATRKDHSLKGSPIDTFSRLYRRVYGLVVGENFLDAGCSFGFLPLLIAEHFPSLTQVVGIDIRPESFAIAYALAEERHLKQVQFLQANLLTDEFSWYGYFDTITLLHVLEHFSEDEMFVVLTSLLRITRRRLIIAVPYEQEEPESAYGHKQLFSRTKLEAVGSWCLQQWKQAGTMMYEECADGLLIVERFIE